MNTDAHMPPHDSDVCNHIDTCACDRRRYGGRMYLLNLWPYVLHPHAYACRTHRKPRLRAQKFQKF